MCIRDRLNDSFILEASRALGNWAVQEKGNEETIMRALFGRILARPPDSHELQVMAGFHAKQTKRFTTNKKMATEIAGPNPKASSEAVAAWVALARSLLNTHEFITRN